jgi:YVTN family beta-propeller protein
VYDTNNVFITTIPLGTSVRSLAFTSDGLKCYVSNDNASQVFVVDAVLRTLSSTIIVGMAVNPRGIAVSHDDSKVYAVGQVNRDIAVISTASDTVVATIAIPSFGGSGAKRSNVVFHPAGGFAYVGDQDAAIVHEIDAVSDVVTGRTVAVAANPRGIEISEDGSKLFVATADIGNTLHVIDTATMTIDSSVAGITSPLELGLGNEL